MASKNVVLKGATWNGVESVDFPVSGGGTALYVETSDADATASDIASGKKAYVNGSLIVGTASGGGGGLEYETGTWTPAADIADYTIPFADTHTEEPFYYSIINSDNTTFVTTPYTNTFQSTIGFKGGSIATNSSQNLYVSSIYCYTNSGGTSSTYNYQSITASSTYSDFFKKTGIRAYTNSTSRYWRSGITYKWIAVWKPTS